MNRLPPALPAVIFALLLGVLGLYGALHGAPRAEPQPFANSVEQRLESVNELRSINNLLREQNALLKEQLELLRSGQMKVILTLPPKQAESNPS